LLKGLIRCAYCLLPMWAQTYNNGNRYYREHKGFRGDGYCVNRSRSMSCRVPDDQVGQIMQAILLPDAWMDRVLARIHLAGEMDRIEDERLKVDQRLKRLGNAYVDGLYGEEDYRREKRSLEEKSASLVIPGIDAALEAGKLLEHLPTLWAEADMGERRRLLGSMLEAAYVDTVEEKSVVAIRPKLARPLFEIATTRGGSDVVLYKRAARGFN
jgi:site-specific DNA recombinase